MSIIIVDGPEKAGKTTTIRYVQHMLEASGLTERVVIRKWTGRADPDDRVYTPDLIKAASAPVSKLIEVWDRGWPSEYVYGLLLGQPRRLAGDPWLGEWLHTRAVVTNGLPVILLGESSEQLAADRSDDDLQVDPTAERRLFENYAMRYGWAVFDRRPVEELALSIVNRFLHSVNPELEPRTVPLPPVYAGPRNARVLFVGEQRSDMSMPGGWLPFSSRLTTMLGRSLGDRALEVGWTNALDFPPKMLEQFSVFVACGAVAAEFLSDSVDWSSGKQMFAIDHPAHTFRFNNEITRTRRVQTYQTINEVLKEV